MANPIFTPGFHFYQSANADARLVKDNFLVRINEFNIIIDDIKRQPQKGSVQHFLLIGRRGSGKSTLLKRLQIEVETDPDLVKRYITINLAEEQANIYKLYDLLEAIVEDMEFHKMEVQVPVEKGDTHQYARDLFSAIHNSLKKSGKKLVLLLDNIDRIFENLDEDASLLREYLLNYDDLKIIGSSTKMTEHFWKYNQPFYQFFRVLELKPLTSDEIKSLLLDWSERINIPELKEFVRTKTGQLETIRLLTDGLPRTLQFFVNILITRAQETGYEYLRLIMDSVTPLYQERLNTLPPAQRKIVLQMAFLWEGVGAKEIAEATHMDVKVISAQLKPLAEKGIVDKLETHNKNHLYRLSERFFNLWLIFTQGSPKEKRKAKCLTVFMENFYDEQEIEKIATEHLQLLQSGNAVANKAALITKALAQSRFINVAMRDDLISKTLALSEMAIDLRNQLPPTKMQILDDVFKAIGQADYDKAMRIAKELEQNDGASEILQAAVYGNSGNNKEALRCYQVAFDKGFTACAVQLAKLYEANGNIELAEKYYIIGIGTSFPYATYYLANFYEGQSEMKKAEIFYKQAIEKEEWQGALSLGRIYFIQSKDKEAERYLKIAIDHKQTSSAINLSILYYVQNKNKENASALVELERQWNPHSELNFEAEAIVIDLWQGRLSNLEARAIKYLNNGKWNQIPFLLRHLLVHNQLNLVNNLFNDKEFGHRLKEENLPLYYAYLKLSGEENNPDLKIPPEINEIVNQEIMIIMHFRKLYYPS
jgi:TPR repeat protein/energy-coupling factor transporter ATP-binding protein EcfA2